MSANRAENGPVILQVIPSLDAGGAERSTIDIASALSRTGWRALVATKGGRMVPELTAQGGEWIALPLDGKLPHRLVANAMRLSRLIRARKVAILHARSRAPAWSALLAAQMTGVPFVTTYHGIYNANNPAKRFYNSVMARSDAVIANSEWTAAHIAEQYRFKPKHLQVIPRGVDLAHFDIASVSAERVAAMRAKWGAKPDDTVVILPGRLTRWKGQAIFITAMAQLKQSGRLKNVRGVLMGDSQGRLSYENELRTQIAEAGLAETVIVSEHENDMPTAYRAADIVVSASTDPEAFGRVAAEAGAMERPVIATDHGGAREVILRDRSGLLSPPGDANALAAALSKLLADGALRTSMGREARAHVSERFTVDRMCADTLALYARLLGERR
jgi:glycosyltransferase involved in cell wall biosynthesis